jgi:hypothetical protein
MLVLKSLMPYRTFPVVRSWNPNKAKASSTRGAPDK